MRIGIEAQRVLRPKKHGMDIVALELLRQLQPGTPAHQFFVYAQPDADVHALAKNGHLQVRQPGPASYPVWEQRILPRAAAQDRLDLLHCTSNTAPVATSVPLVVTIHDIIYLEQLVLTEGSWYQRLGNLYRRWNVPRIAKKAAAIITVSEFERQRIIEGLNMPPERVVTVYNACGDHFTPDADISDLEAFRRKMNLPERFVLFLGNTAPKKNLPNVLKALAILHQQKKLDFTLVMPDFGQEHLQRLLQAQGNTHLLQHIQLTGYVPNADLPNLYRLASLFLYPSVRESFGIPILEAMACGTPVITSNTSAMPEVAGSGALLVDPHSPEALAHSIVRVLEDDQLRRNIRAYGIKRAADFSWQKTAAGVMDVYHNVLQ